MTRPTARSGTLEKHYQSVAGDVAGLIDAARGPAARSVNAVMAAGHWLVPRYIVEFEQTGEERADYGTALPGRLSEDPTRRFAGGFSRQSRAPSIWRTHRRRSARQCLVFRTKDLHTKQQTVSVKPNGRATVQTASAETLLAGVASRSQLPCARTSSVCKSVDFAWMISEG